VKGYALTRYGKILVAMLIVSFIVIPSLILVIWAVTRRATIGELHYESNGTVEVNAESSMDEPDIHDSSENESVYDDFEPSDPEDFDLAADLLIFLILPGSQASLDEDTIHAIGEFLTLHEYSDGDNIAVEIPQLSDEDMGNVTTAVLSALQENNVSINDIIFYIYQPESDSIEYEIRISFGNLV